ncbi:hypothetical protein Aph01nite_08640 [Acrocarpospora phusangensis]|uniref:Secreted protein n=2 Tax=Acrocarpospora phusangensis TaxID=1070424 RepID=A0A919Q7B7_9ACTN|nr:hypothetical protein Aph01nite_08640 [Acrocarpospora phusangensis]
MLTALLGVSLAAGPAAAEPYGTRTCSTPPVISCGTGGLEPHSSEGWLEVRLNPTGSAVCHVRWDLYDLNNNWSWEGGGTKYLLSSSTTFKVYDLAIGHNHRLEANSNNCVLSIRLRNFT